MDIQHAMSCIKEGFTIIRCNDLYDLTTNLLTEECESINIRPQILPVTGETFNNRATNTSNEARASTKLRGFWVRDQQTFFHVRVFDPNTDRYLNKALSQCYI